MLLWKILCEAQARGTVEGENILRQRSFNLVGYEGRFVPSCSVQEGENGVEGFVNRIWILRVVDTAANTV